jgi:hypothetical protein
MTSSLLSLCLVGMTLAPAVFAKATKSSVVVAATTGSPEFRDPRTGQVWTPETVGQDGRPIGPEDAAFNPRAQAAPMQTVLQKATARPVGQVPFTAGTAVPVVSMGNAMSSAVPGQRWQVVMYPNNNSGNPIDPVVDCRFTNAGNAVMDTRALPARRDHGTFLSETAATPAAAFSPTLPSTLTGCRVI